MQNPITRLARIVRARAKHYFALPLTVKQIGNGLTLTVTQKRTGEKATETFLLDTQEIEELLDDEQAIQDCADCLITRFMYPVRPLMLLED